MEEKIKFDKDTGVWGTITHICTPLGVLDVKDIKEEEKEVKNVGK